MDSGVTRREGGGAPEADEKDRLWPVILAIALAVVVLVNGVFIYIAVTGADPVAPSYNSGER